MRVCLSDGLQELKMRSGGPYAGQVHALDTQDGIPKMSNPGVKRNSLWLLPFYTAYNYVIVVELLDDG